MAYASAICVLYRRAGKFDILNINIVTSCNPDRLAIRNFAYRFKVCLPISDAYNFQVILTPNSIVIVVVATVDFDNIAIFGNFCCIAWKFQCTAFTDLQDFSRFSRYSLI